MTIADEIKNSFKSGSMLTRLIYINLGVFLAVNIVLIFFFLLGVDSVETLNVYFHKKFLVYFMVSADLSKLIFKPWTLITYMFLHSNFWHILFNMIWLFMFGRIFLRYLDEKLMLSTYILGGISGALLFILLYNIFPGMKNLPDNMLGASAGVMAVAMAICFYVPNFSVYIPLISSIFGPVKLKYIAIFFIITDIMQIASYNAGGHIAHLGGVIYGYFFVQQYKRGKVPGRGVNSLVDSIASLFKPRRRRMKVSYKRDVRDMTDMEYNKYKAESQEEVDRILDKIAKSGYDSLSKKEKETLFKMGNKN